MKEIEIDRLGEIIQDKLCDINGKKQEVLKDKLKGAVSTPGEANLDNIRSVGETAFQRAIFNKRISRLKHESGKETIVTWLDLELPVVLTKSSRRSCIDLIGRIESNKKLVLCELKFKKINSNSSSDKPEYAVLELLTYYYMIFKNYKDLDKNEIHHTNSGIEKFKWEDFKSKNPMLIVVANKNYWDYWLDANVRSCKKNYKEKKLVLFLKELKAKLPIENDLCLFKTPDENFEEQQRAHGGKYKPELKKSKVWAEL